MKRYNFGQNEFGDTGITAWAEVEDGVCIDSEITVPSDTLQWLRNCIEAGFHQGDIIWDMIDAQKEAGVQTDFVDAVRKGQIAQSPEKDEEDNRDDAEYHKDI